jgi:predicted transcriptional regulator
MANTEKLVIKVTNRPPKNGNEDLYEWFCEVFGLANKGAEIEPLILKEIVGNSVSGEGVTSKNLNEKLSIPRSTVIYHLNRFIYSGLVIRKGRKYYLRSNDMESTIEELQADMVREFNRMMEFAEMLDKITMDVFYGRRKRQK